MKTLLKKVALMFPAVRKVKADLQNRRQLAEEYESANTLLRKKVEYTHEQLKLMKLEMVEMLELKKSAIHAESTLGAKAKHFQSQLSIMASKYERQKLEIEKLDAENCQMRLENDDLIKINASLAAKR